MNEKQSIVKKTESALDDLLDLWSRRKLVCIIVLAVIILPAGFTLYQQIVSVPKLKSVSNLAVQGTARAGPFCCVPGKARLLVGDVWDCDTSPEQSPYPA